MCDNIKVAIKVVPLIPGEKETEQTSQWRIIDNTITSTDPNLFTESYCFDHIFNETASNQSLFEIVAKPIVAKCLRGHNGTIVAYGQPTSGKTHTMIGTKIEMGVIPLSIQQIFHEIKSRPQRRQYVLSIAYIEINNNKIFNLLSEKQNEAINSDLRSVEDSAAQCQEIIVDSPETVMHYLAEAGLVKRIEEINENERAGRSNRIFRVTIQSTEISNSEHSFQISNLSFVDLAGVGVSDQTLSDNKSETYSNYLNSELCVVLQNSLVDNTVTSVICMISPTFYDETNNILMFATHAKNMTNTPILNKPDSGDANVIRFLEKENDRLKKELLNSKFRIEGLERDIDEREIKFVGSCTIRTRNKTRRQTWPPSPKYCNELSVVYEENETDGDELLNLDVNLGSWRNLNLLSRESPPPIDDDDLIVSPLRDNFLFRQPNSIPSPRQIVMNQPNNTLKDEYQCYGCDQLKRELDVALTRLVEMEEVLEKFTTDLDKTIKSKNHADQERTIAENKYDQLITKSECREKELLDIINEFQTNKKNINFEERVAELEKEITKLETLNLQLMSDLSNENLKYKSVAQVNSQLITDLRNGSALDQSGSLNIKDKLLDIVLNNSNSDDLNEVYQINKMLKLKYDQILDVIRQLEEKNQSSQNNVDELVEKNKGLTQSLETIRLELATVKNALQLTKEECVNLENQKDSVIQEYNRLLNVVSNYEKRLDDLERKTDSLKETLCVNVAETGNDGEAGAETNNQNNQNTKRLVNEIDILSDSFEYVYKGAKDVLLANADELYSMRRKYEKVLVERLQQQKIIDELQEKYDDSLQEYEKQKNNFKALLIQKEAELEKKYNDLTAQLQIENEKLLNSSLEAANKIDDLENKYSLILIEKQSLEKTVQHSNEKLDILERKIKDVDAANKRLLAKKNELNTKLEALENAYNDIKIKKTTVEADLKSELDSLEIEKISLQNTIAMLEGTKSDLISQRNANKKEFEKLKKTFKNLQNNKSLVEREKAAQITSLTQKHIQKEKDFQFDLNASESKFEALTEELTILQRRYDKLQVNLKNSKIFEQKCEQLACDNNALREQHTLLEDISNELEKSIATLESENKILKESIQNLEVSLVNQSSQIFATNTRLIESEEKQIKLKEMLNKKSKFHQSELDTVRSDSKLRIDFLENSSKELLAQLHELQHMHLFKTNQYENSITSLKLKIDECNKNLMQIQKKSNLSKIKLLVQNSDLKKSNQTLYDELDNIKRAQTERKSRRSNTYDRNRRVLVSVQTIGTMTDKSEKSCSCDIMNEKIKELTREICMKECQITNYQMQEMNKELIMECSELRDQLSTKICEPMPKTNITNTVTSSTSGFSSNHRVQTEDRLIQTEFMLNPDATDELHTIIRQHETDISKLRMRYEETKNLATARRRKIDVLNEQIAKFQRN